MVDLFGIKEHEQQHQDLSKHIRRLYEEMARIAIDVGALRADLSRMARDLEGKVSADEVDPALTGLDDGLSNARTTLAEAQSASEDAWSELYGQLQRSIDDVRRGVDAAAEAYARESSAGDESG